MENVKLAIELANLAKTHVDDDELFKKYIQKIVDIEDKQLIKSDLINLIGAGYGNWSEEFLLHDIKYCKLPSKIVSLLVWYLMINDLQDSESEKIVKEIIITKFNELEDVAFYALAYELLNNNDIPRSLIPKMFSLEESAYSSIELINLVRNQFALDKEGRIVVNKEWLSAQNELEQEFNDFSEKDLSEEDIYGDYWTEEILYRSCFDKDGKVDIDKLKNVQNKSSKARYKLLQIVDKEKILNADKAAFSKKAKYYELFKNNEMSTDDYFDFLNKYDWKPETFEEGGKYGLKYSYGKVLIPAILDNITLYSGWGSVDFDVVAGEQNGKWGFVKTDGSGDWLIHPQYDEVGFPNNMTYVKIGEKHGVIDIYSAEIVIPIDCEMVFSNMGIIFNNGNAIFKKDGKFGLLNESGQLSKAIFDEVEILGLGDTVRVRIKDKWGWVNENGEFTTDKDESSFLCNDAI